MKPNDLTAQFDIQFTGSDSKLDDIGVVTLVRQSLAAMRLIIIASHPFKALMRFMDQSSGVDRCVFYDSAAVGDLSPVRSKNSVCSAGTTTSRMIGPMNIPPTTTVAKGRCT